MSRSIRLYRSLNSIQAELVETAPRVIRRGVVAREDLVTTTMVTGGMSTIELNGPMADALISAMFDLLIGGESDGQFASGEAAPPRG